MSDEPAPRPVPRTVTPGQRWAPLVERLHELRADPRFGVVALLVVALAAGLVWYRIGLGSTAAASSADTAVRSKPSPTTSTPATRQRATSPTEGAPSTSAPAAELVVHVSGAVSREGLVRVPPGSRVADAIAAAGGAAPGADLRRLNLAAKVADGQQVAVPAAGEPLVSSTPAAGGSAPASTDAPLDVNTATEAQLEALPGIGPSLARAIVAERERAGGFRTVDDLRKVRGIGDARFAQLRPLVRV
jgi:competence protein ComEA